MLLQADWQEERKKSEQSSASGSLLNKGTAAGEATSDERREQIEFKGRIAAVDAVHQDHESKMSSSSSLLPSRLHADMHTCMQAAQCTVRHRHRLRQDGAVRRARDGAGSHAVKPSDKEKDAEKRGRGSEAKAAREANNMHASERMHA